MSVGFMSFRQFILGLLRQQPMSGYDIKRLFEILTWLVGGPSLSSIYTNLHALLKNGLVSVEVVRQQNRPWRKVYSITEAGEQTLQESANQPVASQVSLRAFLMRLIVARSFSEERLICHLQQRRVQVAAQLAALKETARAQNEKTDFKRLALDYGFAMGNSELAWLDNTVNRLSKKPLPMEVVRGN
jgi:DNA-binding PadR family transcriptional regulator